MGTIPYVFFVGRLLDYDTMTGSSSRQKYAGYLMKYSMTDSSNLKTESC